MDNKTVVALIAIWLAFGYIVLVVTPEYDSPISSVQWSILWMMFTAIVCFYGGLAVGRRRGERDGSINTLLALTKRDLELMLERTERLEENK